MDKLINQYSAVWFVFALIGILGFILLRNDFQLSKLLVLTFIILAALGAWLVVRPRQTVDIRDPASVQAAIGGGTPVLLEFQSQY